MTELNKKTNIIFFLATCLLYVLLILLNNPDLAFGQPEVTEQDKKVFTKSPTEQDKILDEGTFTKPVKASQIDTSDSDCKTFRNKEYGYIIKCPPNNWRKIEESTDHSDDIRLHCVHFSSLEKEEISITVYPKYWEGAIREACSIILEERIIVGGMEGVKIIGQDQKDHDLTVSPIISVVMIMKGNYLYVLKGKGESFDHIVSTFAFIK